MARGSPTRGSTGERGACACTTFATGIQEIRPGAAQALDATFPAPPAGVKVVDVQLPVFGLVRDVAIASGNA